MWEGESVNLPATVNQADAACLRNAAAILQMRARRRTFVLLVIVKVLRNTADRLDRSA
jgi:hypothetical protein